MVVIKLLLILIFSLNGFGILGLSNTIILFGIICVANSAFFSQNPYKKILLLIFLSITLSFIPAHLYRDQSFFETFKASANFFYYIVFFAILQLNPNIKQTEKTVEYLSILAASIYILQYILLPKGVLIIPVGEQYIENTTSDHVGRFRIIGSGIFSLTCFYGINKYILTSRLKYLALSFLNVIPIILMGFRTMLAGVAIFSIILLFKVTGGRLQNVLKYMIVATVVILVGLQIPAVSNRVDYMIGKQTDGTETFANDDYIRWIEFEYFTIEYPESFLDRILGSGHPFIESNFGKFHENLQYRGIHYSDWGLIGFSWTIGPFTVLLMIWMSIVVIRQVSNRQYLYISIWLLYMITVSFTSMEYFRPGNFCITSLVLYISHLVNKHNNLNEKNRNTNISLRT